MDITPTLSPAAAAAWRPALLGLADEDLLAFYHSSGPQLPHHCVCVEIGVWMGRSLLYLAELLAAHGQADAQVLGVDPYRYPPVAGDPECCTVPWEMCLRSLLEHGGEAELRLIHLWRMASARAAMLWPCQSVDLVMIDGDHSYEGCRRDIALWLPRVRPGGVLAGHDYAPECPGVIQAVDELRGRVQRHGTVWWVDA